MDIISNTHYRIHSLRINTIDVVLYNPVYVLYINIHVYALTATMFRMVWTRLRGSRTATASSLFTVSAEPGSKRDDCFGYRTRHRTSGLVGNGGKNCRNTEKTGKSTIYSVAVVWTGTREGWGTNEGGFPRVREFSRVMCTCPDGSIPTGSPEQTCFRRRTANTQ